MSEERKPYDVRLPHVLRLTFGLVHATLLSILSFVVVVWMPSVSDWSFSWFGCMLMPILSLCLTVFCTGCVQYVSQGTYDMRTILQTAWIPPLGVFCISLLILPLQFMQGSWLGPMSTLMATSIGANAIGVGILQNVALRWALDPPPHSEVVVGISATSSSSSSGSGPK